MWMDRRVLFVNREIRRRKRFRIGQKLDAHKSSCSTHGEATNSSEVPLDAESENGEIMAYRPSKGGMDGER